MAVKKSEIQWEADGKPLRAYLASSASDGPGLLVLPSWFGLKPFFKQVCDRLAENGYTALGLDYYNGHIGHTVEEAQTLQEGVESDLDAMGAMVKAAKDHLASLRPGRPVGILGFSMGTDWAVITGANEPDVAAIVLFYGGWVGDFSNMKSRVLGHYAENDEYQSPQRTNGMVENMKAAGVDVTIYNYPGTAHWFMEEDRAEYNPAAVSLAWERTLAFLKQSLK
jgi:carboxymethylenebutenolidase